MILIYKPLPWQEGLGYEVDMDHCRIALNDLIGVGHHQCMYRGKYTIRFRGKVIKVCGLHRNKIRKEEGYEVVEEA